MSASPPSATIVTITSCDGIQKFYESIQRIYQGALRHNQIVILDLMSLSRIDSKALQTLSKIAMDLQDHHKKLRLKVPDRFLTAVTLEGLGDYIDDVVDLAPPASSAAPSPKPGPTPAKASAPPAPPRPDPTPATATHTQPPVNYAARMARQRRWRRWLGSVAAVLLIVWGYHYLRAKWAEDYFRHGTNPRLGLPERIVLLKKAVAWRNSRRYRIALGQAYLEAGQGAKAYALFSALAAEAGTQAAVLAGQARAAFLLGRQDEAWQHYQALLALRPPKAYQAYYDLGQIAYQRHQYQQAAAYLSKALMGLPVAVQIRGYEQLGKIYEQHLQQPIPASFIYEKLLVLCPQKKEYRWRLLKLYQVQKDDGHALDHLIWFMQHDPSQAKRVFPMMMATFKRLGRPEQAMAQCRELIPIYLRHDKRVALEIMKALLRLYLQRQKYQQAESLLASMIASYPYYIPPYLTQLRLLHRAGKTRRRLKVAQQLLTQSREHLAAFTHLVSAYLQLGELEKARAVLPTVPSQPWRTLLRAQILTFERKYRAALACCRRLLSYPQLAVPVANQLGLLQMRTGDYAGALETLTAVTPPGQNPAGQLLLARLYMCWNAPAQARQYLQYCQQAEGTYYERQAQRLAVLLDKGWKACLPSRLQKARGYLAHPDFAKRPLLAMQADRAAIRLALAYLGQAPPEQQRRLLNEVRRLKCSLCEPFQGQKLPAPPNYLELGGYAFADSDLQFILEEEARQIEQDLELWHQVSQSLNHALPRTKQLATQYRRIEQYLNQLKSPAQRLAALAEGVLRLVTSLNDSWRTQRPSANPYLSYLVRLRLKHPHPYQGLVTAEAAIALCLLRQLEQYGYLWRPTLTQLRQKFWCDWRQSASLWDQRRAALFLTRQTLFLLAVHQQFWNAD